MTPILTHIAIQVRSLDASIAFYKTFCGLHVVHDRGVGRGRVVWLAREGDVDRFIFVLMEGSHRPPQAEKDYSHLGFAMHSRAEVDAIAARAKEAGFLVWSPRDEPYPVGYYCGLKDPDGYFVEFSYGQPLGPGAPEIDLSSSPKSSI